MNAQLATRQRIRKTLIIVSFLLFPVIMNYLSPCVILDGASQGIVNGSLIVFGLQFVSALLSLPGWRLGSGAGQDVTPSAGWRRS